MTLIGDIKRLLLHRPEDRDRLHDGFMSEGFRIPVRDYSGAIYDASYLERIGHWAKRSWFRGKIGAVTIGSIIAQARRLKDSYESEFRELLDGADELDGFERKRRIPKLRMRAGRLIYLATDESLSSLSSVANKVPELHLHAEVMSAVATGNIDPLLEIGSNAAQAAAQPLRAIGRRAVTGQREFTEAETQALVVFVLNGVTVDYPQGSGGGDSELMRFAVNGADAQLMKNSKPYIRELACLHGLAAQPRHSEVLETAFDEDEVLAMDAIEQLQQSGSA